ncbi:GNAT family N-acetyltransferase [Roseovarius pacificus]|uniref:GNAT family N-acetyltransferase n=1 Tax=Roseovarius pacificus TaxID=337701 RepID=UPI00403A5EE5
MSRSAPEDQQQFRLDAYTATIRPITPDDRSLLHELTLSVFWRHRTRDLDFFISLGQGYIALDEIGRPLGSAMYYPSGPDFATFGLMITTPRLQALGAGRRLLRRILRDCEGRDVRLMATKSAYWLYEAAGFVPVGTIWQHEGVARDIHLPDPVPGVEICPLEPAHLPAVLALDAQAYGAYREVILNKIMSLSEGVVALRDGVVCGFAMMRPFGRVEVIGPLVAEDDRMAMQLCAVLIQRRKGHELRVDTPQQSEHFKAFLAAAGLGVVDTVTEMRMGRARGAADGPVIYGLAAQSLG